MTLKEWLSIQFQVTKFAEQREHLQHQRDEYGAVFRDLAIKAAHADADPGSQLLKSLAIAEGEPELSSKWVEQKRAELIAESSTSEPENVDSLELIEFARAIRGGQEPTAAKDKQKGDGSKLTTEDLMKKMLDRTPESLGWPLSVWSEEIGRSKSAIQKTQKWGDIMKHRDWKKREIEVDEERKYDLGH